MNNIRKYTAWLGAGAIMITLAAGCTNQNSTAVGNVAESAAEATGNVAESAVDTTGNVASAAGDNMTEGANTAVDATGNVATAAGSNLEALGDAATYTPKIKTALGAEPALKGSEINVDTLGEKDTIALRGTVTSAAQKTLAENVAKKNAPGFKIANQLKMGGAM